MPANTSLVSGRSRVRVPQPAPFFPTKLQSIFKGLRCWRLPAWPETGREQTGTKWTRFAGLDADSPQKAPKVIRGSFAPRQLSPLGGEG